MKKYAISIWLLFVILFSFEAGFAKIGKIAENSKNPVASPLPVSETIKTISQQVMGFRDPKVTAVSLAQIADLVWENDKEYARYLFTISLGKLVIEEKDSEREITLKNATYRKVLSLIAKHDPHWTKELVKSFAKETTDQAETDLEIADRLLETDTKRAAEFAEQSLQTEFTEGFVRFLKNLRQQNEAEANRLFLQAIALYPRQARVDANQFALLGTYLFTSPFINPQDYQTISLTRVGNIGFPNITVNLPNIPAGLVREYIRNAVLVISRPTNDHQQRQIKYALGYLLLPKAQEFAPDLVGAIGGAMAALNSVVPPEMTNEEAFKYHKKTTTAAPSERIEEIEKLTDSYTRDQLLLDVAFQAWRQNDFQTAGIAAAKIENNDVRRELEILILFGEANNLLKNGQTSLGDVIKLTEKLPVSLEKSLLWLGIAAEKQKKAFPANVELDAAQTTAIRLNDENTPFLLLFVSGQMAKNNDFQSDAILTEAIKAFNKFENLTKPSLMRKVTLDPLNVRFNLVVSGVNLEFQNSFENAISDKEENAVQIIEDLKNESLKGQAFVVLVKLILAKKPKPVKTKEAVVRVGEDGIQKSAVKKVLPIYPAETLKKLVKGVAVAEVQYDGNGDVSEVKILESPDSATGEAVTKAVRQWKFKPSKMDNKPVSIRGKITFNFIIDAKGKGEIKIPVQLTIAQNKRIEKFQKHFNTALFSLKQLVENKKR